MLKFSGGFKKVLAGYGNHGYEPKMAEVNYMVYWQKEDAGIEVKIILPELQLIKRGN